ncbi:Peptidoglycan O-acetyltransferase [Achromobacter insolitus]|uniref:MBOAT family O-acyltransferase n=1 Tax=Achromobacter insolitus TaxID=217204 RepID=UPI000B2864F6|nr:MBOAT family O-acyltransferase [Achromobacter insolitus]AVG43145.1 membrane-bound O-acyltransferase family protein [Achromobacter insolitus]CAB3951422.1 Peptidoglycan O-acetyltransferase [Achromobacter insolitus]
MLFFELDFLLVFLLPLLLIVISMKTLGFAKVLPWIASASSIAFLYAFSAISVVVALFSLLLNYYVAAYFLKHKSKSLLLSTIFVNLAVLGYFKYSILVDRSLFDGNSSWAWRIALPLGISFYTFQQIAFLVDVYKGKVESFSFKTYILFKLFFPQFVAGPITHFGRVAASYERWPRFNIRSIKFGLAIFAFGMIKKLIGDHFGVIANNGFSHQAAMSTYDAWVAMFAFTLQIYFDFSGYSDMAVGVARIFGVNLPYNFNSPYKAKSLSDFWRRWHITLSQWLRDYLYISLGGNRRGAVRMAVALFVTMALGGLWHGANWTFLLWGVAHGLALIAVRFFGFPAPVLMRQSLVFLFVMLTWILFRSESLSGALHHYGALFDFSNVGLGVEAQRLVNIFVPSYAIDAKINKPHQLFEIAAILMATILCFVAPNSRRLSVAYVACRVRPAMLIEIPLLVALIVILSVAFVSPDTANAFIYFEF